MTLESLARTIAKARHGTDAHWAHYVGAARAVVAALGKMTPASVERLVNDAAAAQCVHEWLPHFEMGSEAPINFVCKLCGSVVD